MERPCRERGDELLKPGELADIRRRLRKIAPKHDLASVIACAFDHRTRMLPFIYADIWMVPAGVRAVGAAMLDAGFQKTRIVLQQWNRNFRPSRMRLDGRVPDIFMVSSLQVHAAQCRALIRDACRIDPARRPLIVAGGPQVIYEPWSVFGAGAGDPWGADVAVTGEEFVLLSLLEVLLSVRRGNEPLRTTFLRAANGGMLDEIPGLVYARADGHGTAEELVDTGIQRLVADLAELPEPVLGFRVLEPPGSKATLGPRPLPADRVCRYSPIASLVMTFGCRFTCPYCPIPAYNQRQHRMKTGEQIAGQMRRIHREYGIRNFCGVGGNFFNDPDRALEIADTLARRGISGPGFAGQARWGTEATVHDSLRVKDNLPLLREAGLQALWLGVEDMTATLINKGQTVENTLELFRLLRAHGIFPMPMLMHHDAQPLHTRGSPYGLLNQVHLLRKAGAIDLQVLMITPATGSKLYDEAFTSGLAYQSVGGRPIEPRMRGDSYVIASRDDRPWQKQLNLLAAYLLFYNPMRFLLALVRPQTRPYLVNAGAQLLGMWGLVQTFRRTFGWAMRLMLGRIRRSTRAPASPLPMRSAAGGPASYAPPAAPSPKRSGPHGRPVRRWKSPERSLDVAEV